MGQVARHTRNGVVVLAFTDALLTAESVKEVTSIVDSVEPRQIVLDCESVLFLVSGSLYPDQDPLAPLVKLSRRLTDEGSRLVFCNVASEIAHVLRVTRLDQLFSIQPDVDSAVACIGSVPEKQP